MIDIAKGRYWDLPWSLVDGCTPCSPGCDHCWSAAMAHRFGNDRLTVIRFCQEIVKRQDGVNYAPRFTGKIITHPDRLSIPLKRRKPTVYAVWNDFWHESVPDDFQYKAYDTMVERHTFLILTKRPHIAVAYYAEGKHEDLLPRDNIWHGLTVVNQAEVDEKIPVFLHVPGKKFLSIEPMLGVISLRWLAAWNGMATKPREWGQSTNEYDGLRLIDAVILGGETGPGARPMHPDWVRSVRDQCVAAGVSFFFKGWGEWEIASYENGHYGSVIPEDGKKYRWIGKNGKTFFPSAPKDQNCWAMARVGKNKSGRLLDGRTHDELLWRSSNN